MPLGEELEKLWNYPLVVSTRALSQHMTNAPEGALTPNLKNIKVTVQNK